MYVVASSSPPIRRAGKAPRLRETTLDDYEQIARLEALYGLDAVTYQEWSHLWLANPVFRHEPGWPIGWVLEHEGRIVGSMGNIPLEFEIGGQKILASSGRSWVVHPEYRSPSLVLLDR